MLKIVVINRQQLCKQKSTQQLKALIQQKIARIILRGARAYTDIALTTVQLFRRSSLANLTGTRRTDSEHTSGIFRDSLLPFRGIVVLLFLYCDSANKEGSTESADFQRVFWSERRDLNSRPPVPQTGALTGLRHAPMAATIVIGHIDRNIPPRINGETKIAIGAVAIILTRPGSDCGGFWIWVVRATTSASYSPRS
jgi:hypothetical protein